MPRVKRTEDELTKFQRYRQQQRHKGMKLLRLWVPDPNLPDFAEEAARQGRLLRQAPEEAEAMRFIASAFEWSPA